MSSCLMGLKGLLSAPLEREEWPLNEAMAVAREKRLMFAGALEEINEWAFEVGGSQLLWEDGEVLKVEGEILAENCGNVG